MDFGSAYSQRTNLLPLNAQRDVLTDFLEGDGELVLEVANAEGQPSFEDIDREIKDGVYVCVNPSNVGKNTEFEKYQDNENILLTNGDGLLSSSINDVIGSLEDYQETSIESEETAYLSRMGVPYMFKYCDRNFGSFQDYNTNLEEDLEELTQVYVDNLDQMDVDHICLTFPELMDETSFYEGHGIPKGTPRTLFTGIEDRLREKGWNVTAGKYSRVERTHDIVNGGIMEEERTKGSINADR